MTATATARAEAFYAAVGRGEIGEALELLGPSVHWYEADGMPYQRPGGAPYTGAGEVAEHVLSKITADVDGLKLDELGFTGLGRSVAVSGTYRGVAQETRRRVDQPFVHIWTFGADGTPAEFRQFTDTARFRETIGRA